MKLTRRWVQNVVPTTERREAQRIVVGGLLENREKKMNTKVIRILSCCFIPGVHKFSKA
jgi:hypothetical protein